MAYKMSLLTVAVYKDPSALKGSKEHYLLEQKYNLQIFGVIPFIKLQNDT